MYLQGSLASYLLGYNEYLIQFLARNNLLLVPATISEIFPDAKSITGFRLSHYNELKRISAKPRFSGAIKRYTGYKLYFPIPETQLFSLGWVLDENFFYIFVLNVGKREVDSQTLEMAIKSNMLQLVDLVT